jgi:Na+/proline symporter
MNHLAPILLVLAGYVLTMIGLGVAYARYAGSADAVFRAGNVVPWWIAGLSQFMASHSAYLFVVVGGMIYGRGGFGLLWFTLIYPVIVLVGTLFFARRWHRTKVSTPVEYLEKRFGPGVRLAYAWLGLVVRPLNNGVRMAAFGVLMAAIMGLDQKAPLWLGLTAPVVIALLAMALVVTYTLLGGLMGALVADVVQFVIFETALLMLFGLSWRKAGGLHQLASHLPAGFFRLPSLHDSQWLWLAGWLILQLADVSAAQWGLVTRFLCTRNERDARKVGYMCTALYLPLLALCGLPILVARSLNPGLIGEASFGWISQALLPPGLLALMIAAMFSATLATLSAELNTLSGVFTLDVYRRRFRPAASDADLVRVGRLATFFLGFFFSAVAVLVLGGASTVLRATQEISSVIAVPLAVPLLGGMFSARPGQCGVYLSIFLGISTSLAFHFAGAAFHWPDTFMVLLQNGGAAVVSITTLWASGYLTPASAGQRALADAFHAKMQISETVSAEAPGVFPAPLPLVGAGVLAMALVQGGTLFFPAARDAWTAWAAIGLGVLGLALITLGRKTFTIRKT